MSGHTKRSWRAWESPSGEWVIRSTLKVGGDRITSFVAVCHSARQDNEANARLMAASPDLLEAGQALQSARKAQKLAPSAENLSRVRMASAAFDAAIARATEAQP